MLPTELNRIRAREEMHLQRLPAADGRDPSGRPPPALTWARRTLSPIGHEQFLLTVPCLSRRFDRGVHAPLTAHLREQWLRGPVGTWRISFVVVAFDRAPGSFDRLLLAMTATPLGHVQRPLDGPRMGRDLRGALDRRWPGDEVPGARPPALPHAPRMRDGQPR